MTNANSQNEMKMSYLARTIFACASLYDKEEGLNVFTNDYFQQYFTSDDEIDVLDYSVSLLNLKEEMMQYF